MPRHALFTSASSPFSAEILAVHPSALASSLSRGPMGQYGWSSQVCACACPCIPMIFRIPVAVIALACYRCRPADLCAHQIRVPDSPPGIGRLCRNLRGRERRERHRPYPPHCPSPYIHTVVLYGRRHAGQQREAKSAGGIPCFHATAVMHVKMRIPQKRQKEQERKPEQKKSRIGWGPQTLRLRQRLEEDPSSPSYIHVLLARSLARGVYLGSAGSRSSIERGPGGFLLSLVEIDTHASPSKASAGA